MFLAETPRARDYGEKRDGNKREPKTIIIIKFLIPGRLKTKARVFIRRTAGPFVWCKFIRGPGSCSTAVARRLARVGLLCRRRWKEKCLFFPRENNAKIPGTVVFTADHRRATGPVVIKASGHVRKKFTPFVCIWISAQSRCLNAAIDVIISFWHSFWSVSKRRRQYRTLNRCYSVLIGKICLLSYPSFEITECASKRKTDFL